MNEKMIEALIQKGYEIRIVPRRLVSERLDIDTIGYDVQAFKDDKFIFGSVHKLLNEAMLDVFEEIAEIIDPVMVNKRENPR